MAVKKTAERKKAVRRKKAEEGTAEKKPVARKRAPRKTAAEKAEVVAAVVEEEPKENPVVDYLVVFRDSSGGWRWQAKSNNGKVVEASSEGFRNRHYAWNRVHKLFPDAPLRNV